MRIVSYGSHKSVLCWTVHGILNTQNLFYVCMLIRVWFLLFFSCKKMLNNEWMVVYRHFWSEAACCLYVDAVERALHLSSVNLEMPQRLLLSLRLCLALHHLKRSYSVNSAAISPQPILKFHRLQTFCYGPLSTKSLSEDSNFTSRLMAYHAYKSCSIKNRNSKYIFVHWFNFNMLSVEKKGLVTRLSGLTAVAKWINRVMEPDSID